MASMTPDEFRKQFSRALRGYRVEGVSQRALEHMFRDIKANAEKGVAQAQWDYGNCLRYGWGTPKDETGAFPWFMKSVE